VTESLKSTKKRGRPPKTGGAIPSAERQATYRKKKLEDGIEISIFLSHKQAEILRATSNKKGKTQSDVIGGMLENSTKK
jgi:hypothetical protein